MTPELSKKMADAAKASPVLLEKLEAAKTSFEKKVAALDAFKKTINK